MGCGGCQMANVQSPSSTLSTLLQQKINAILANPSTLGSSKFISIEEIKELNSGLLIPE